MQAVCSKSFFFLLFLYVTPTYRLQQSFFGVSFCGVGWRPAHDLFALLNTANTAAATAAQLNARCEVQQPADRSKLTGGFYRLLCGACVGF